MSMSASASMAQNGCTTSIAGAAPAIEVVQPLWAVDADADIDMGFGEERAPCVVDQRAIGLKGMRQLDFRGLQAVDQPKPPPVKVDRQHHRLAGMPNDGNPVLQPAAGEDLRKKIGDGPPAETRPF